MSARLRREEGFTMVAAIATLVIVVALGGALLSLVVRRAHTGIRDLDVARAAEAADAGADVAGWRMNRTLVSAGTAGLLGLATDAARTLGCTTVSAGGFSVVTQSSGWCPTTTSEDLGDGTSFNYSMSLDLNVVGSGLSKTIVRRVIVTGMAGGYRRRILVVYRLDLNLAGGLRLFKRWHYVVCTAKPTGGAADSGCPDPGL